jgi:hypothetical protein
VKLLVGYAVLTYIARSGSADPGEWDNLVPTELAELADIPTISVFSSKSKLGVAALFEEQPAYYISVIGICHVPWQQTSSRPGIAKDTAVLMIGNPAPSDKSDLYKLWEPPEISS